MKNIFKFLSKSNLAVAMIHEPGHDLYEPGDDDVIGGARGFCRILSFDR